MGINFLLPGLLIAVTCLTPSPSLAQSRQSPSAHQQEQNAVYQREVKQLPGDRTVSGDSLNPPPKVVNVAKAKSDAAELAALAKELREELNKPNADVLSAGVVNRAKKIGKLAKRIREETEP